MTRIEALRTLLRYMPERSIHITESLDSSYHLGERRDNEIALVTINPGITHLEPECFTAPTVSDAVSKVLDAIGSITFLAESKLSDKEWFERDQAQSFEALNCEHDFWKEHEDEAGNSFFRCRHCRAQKLHIPARNIGPLIPNS